MRGHAKIITSTILSGATVYLTSNIISAAAPFALLPILTRYLAPSEYGEIAIFLTVLTALPAFVGLNAAGAANRRYFDTGTSEVEMRYYIAACLQILLVSAAAVAAVVFVTGGYISEWIGLRKSWLMWAVLASASLVAVNIRLGQWQVRKQAIQFGALQISQSFLNVGLSLILVISLHYGADGRIAAQISVATLFALLSVWLLFRKDLTQIASYRPEYIGNALRFGVPLIPHALGGFLLIAFDRLVVSNMLGIDKAGVYMVAVQLAGALAIIFDAANKAYVPWLYKKLNDNDDFQKRRIVSYTYVGYVLILAAAGVSFVLGPTLVNLIAGPRYQAAGNVLGWLVLGQGFGGMYLTVANYIFYARKTGWLSAATIASGALHMFLVFFCLEGFGLVGAGIAFSVSTGIRFLLTWWVAHRSHPMPWFHLFSGRPR